MPTNTKNASVARSLSCRWFMATWQIASIHVTLITNKTIKAYS